jgi:hypothetical protein
VRGFEVFPFDGGKSDHPLIPKLNVVGFLEPNRLQNSWPVRADRDFWTELKTTFSTVVGFSSFSVGVVVWWVEGQPYKQLVSFFPG